MLAGRDLARAALAEARQITRAKPPVGRDARRRAANREANARRAQGGYTGPGPDPRDQQLLGTVLGAMFAQREWKQPLAQARIFADWAAVVGAEVAARSQPTELVDGELRISADTTSWASQLRLLTPTIMTRLTAELGPGVVTRLAISGPVAPSWKHGARTVRGHRGPRDTYG